MSLVRALHFAPYGIDFQQDESFTDEVPINVVVNSTKMFEPSHWMQWELPSTSLLYCTDATSQYWCVEWSFCTSQLCQHLWLDFVEQFPTHCSRRNMAHCSWLSWSDCVHTACHVLALLNVFGLELMTPICSPTTEACAYSITAHYMSNELFSLTTLPLNT